MHTSAGTAGKQSGLRSRWLAPVYALVISFLAVLLLGLVVREPTATGPPTRPKVDIRFVTTGPDRTQLDNAQVKVLAGSSTDLRVNAGGGVDDVTSGQSLTICARLPKGWTAPAPAERLGDFTCWPKVDPDVLDDDHRIELTVARSEVPR
ncbi:hypothetical protein AB0425_27420 [Actinosynnema sp. NPDC051121]|nr:hypothetical protein [Saccharothrix sp.]